MKRWLILGAFVVLAATLGAQVQTPPGAGGTSGVSSISGDATLFSNSASTGAVTLTPRTFGAHQWYGNNTASSATPSAQSPHCVDLTDAAASCSTDATNAANIASGSLAPARLTAGIFTCSIAWMGSGSGSALQTGDDAVVNNSCYNTSGLTRTITSVICRSNVAANTVTINPTMGAAGSGTAILSGALTCGSSYAWSSSGTILNASWAANTGVDPGMGGTLNANDISMTVSYHY